ncbi:MAG: hypothetical protein FGM14_14935 [Flavobacteriales bacterium]|nr:hypothetical protein [Flavobacteriales bacterium]
MKLNIASKNIFLFIFTFALYFHSKAQLKNETWSTYKDLQGKFEILTPITPTAKTFNVNSEFGVIESKALTMFSESNINQYLFGYADYPLQKSDSVNDFFNSRIVGSVDNVHGKLLNEEIIKYKNYPGRKIRVIWQNGELVNNIIFYLINDRLYYLQVTCSTSNDFNKDVYKFLNSFKYTE